jgi:hypothetical protein
MPFAYGSKAEPERVELSSLFSESRFERGGLASYAQRFQAEGQRVEL